jgi:hypothetical protein
MVEEGDQPISSDQSTGDALTMALDANYSVLGTSPCQSALEDSFPFDTFPTVKNKSFSSPENFSAGCRDGCLCLVLLQLEGMIWVQHL